MVNVQENVILHYKTFYFGNTCAETWNLSLQKKIDLRKTKLFCDRPSSFYSTYPNIYGRTKKMDYMHMIIHCDLCTGVFTRHENRKQAKTMKKCCECTSAHKRIKFDNICEIIQTSDVCSRHLETRKGRFFSTNREPTLENRGIPHFGREITCLIHCRQCQVTKQKLL
jgi:hypothetical protein